MKTEMRHDESWTISITPDEGETWPMAKPYVTAKSDIRPDRIVISLTRRQDGGLTQHISLAGHNVRKDGTAGARRTSHGVWGTPPEWMREIVAKARAEHGMDSK